MRPSSSRPSHRAWTHRSQPWHLRILFSLSRSRITLWQTAQYCVCVCECGCECVSVCVSVWVCVCVHENVFFWEILKLLAYILHMHACVCVCVCVCEWCVCVCEFRPFWRNSGPLVVTWFSLVHWFSLCVNLDLFGGIVVPAARALRVRILPNV